MKTPILAFLLVLAASSAFAQTFAPELAPAAAKYKADNATLDAQRLAALAQANGNHGEKVSWKLDDDGTLAINIFYYHKRVTFTSPSTADCAEIVGGERQPSYPIHLSDRTITPQ